MPLKFHRIADDNRNKQRLLHCIFLSFSVDFSLFPNYIVVREVNAGAPKRHYPHLPPSLLIIRFCVNRYNTVSASEKKHTPHCTSHFFSSDYSYTWFFWFPPSLTGLDGNQKRLLAERNAW